MTAVIGHCSECLEDIRTYRDDAGDADVTRHAFRHRVGTDGILVTTREANLYAEHAAALAGRVAEYGDHAAGCPQDCPYRGPSHG